MAERLPALVTQIHSNQYRNPAQLPDGRGAGGRLGPIGRADRRRPASRRPQGASRGRRRAALRAVLPRPRRRHLAGRHGLLRDVGRQTIRCATACATTPTITSRAATAVATSTCAASPGRHEALRRAGGLRRRQPCGSAATSNPRSTRPTGPITASTPPSTSSSPRRGSRLRRRVTTRPYGSRRTASPASTSRAPASPPSSGVSASRRTSPGSTPPCSTAAANPKHSARRDGAAGRLLHRAALAAHLGLGPLRRSRPRRAYIRAGDPVAPRHRAAGAETGCLDRRLRASRAGSGPKLERDPRRGTARQQPERPIRDCADRRARQANRAQVIRHTGSAACPLRSSSPSGRSIWMSLRI